MEIGTIVLGVLLGILTILSGIYVSFTARKRGPIFSNTYLWFSKEERKSADKDAEYKLVTIVFGCITGIFGMLTVNIFTDWSWSLLIMWVLIVFVCIYAVVDSIRTSTKK